MQCLYAKAQQKPGIKCVICYYNPNSISHDYSKNTFSFKSLHGFLQCLRAGVIFFDHALVPGITRYRHKCVNLWHGVPIKAIRYFLQEDFSPGYLKQQSQNTSMLISSSCVDRLAMSACFQIPPEKVLLTGLPRNDLLIDPESFIAQMPHLEYERNLITKIKGKRRLVLYAPTYRGSSSQKSQVLTVTSLDEDTLGRVLKKYNAVLGVRGHVFSSKPMFPALFAEGLAVDLSTQIITNTNLLLNYVDLLITDYSSIWVDFILKERPVLAFCPDMEDFLNNRGFIYDFTDIFPGKITTTISELATELDSSLSSVEVLNEKYKKIIKMFHQYHDGHNTDRVLNAVIKL